ncbi:hypothetical protein EWM64_g6432, partial [Hericium alpestre]
IGTDTDGAASAMQAEASAMQAEASAFERLEIESHQLRLDLSARMHADTATGAKYKAIYDSYIKWWTANGPDLLAKHQIQAVIPALPITAMKVTFFLQHETTREKYRKDSAHLYKSDPEAQKKLRDDARISDIERAMRHNEPQRNETANALKASGTSSDAYTPEDLQMCALWCMTSSRTAEQLSLGLRDRAMLLVSAGTAFRGDSARALQWSDLFITHAYVPDIAPDYRLPVSPWHPFGQCKAQSAGRVDEHGVIRHRIVELCPVGAVALHLWAYFHVLSKPVPDFVPDFTDTAFGEFGRRDWYVYHLFYGKDISRRMTYENHHGRLKRMHILNDIAISKVTHATRHYGALNARNHGASIASTKAMGGWNESSGAFRGCYDRSLPLDALLASAMFNGREPSSYFLARDVLAPPEHLLCLIFPWVEQEQRALAERAHERVGSDIALENFLKVLLWFRRVILQDTAVLFSRRPELLIFSWPPFNSPAFREFAEGTSDRIAAAEAKARAAYQNLPQMLVQSMHGITTEWALEQERERAEARARYNDLSEQLLQVKAELVMQNSSRSSRKRRCAPADADASVTTTAADPALAQRPALPGAATALPRCAVQPYATATAAPTSATAMSGAATAMCAGHAVPPVTVHVPAMAPTITLQPASMPAAQSVQQWLPSNPLPLTRLDPSTRKREELRQRYGDNCIAHHPWQLNAGILVPSYSMQPAGGAPLAGVLKISKMSKHEKDSVTETAIGPVDEGHTILSDMRVADDALLAELGYKSEFKREFSLIETVAFAFSIMGIVASVSSTMSFPLASGGHVGMTFGWLIPCFFVLCIAAMMAEMTSAMPYVFLASSPATYVLIIATNLPDRTSAGLYYFSAKLAPPRFAPLASWITGWANVTGQVALVCSIDFTCAQMITTAIAVGSDGETVLGSGATYGILIAILLSHGIVCSAATRVLARLNLFYVVINVGTSIAAIVALVVGAGDNKVSSKDAWTMFENNTGWANNGWAFLLAFTSPMWTLTGYDSAAHISEEVAGAARAAPIAIMVGVLATQTFGWALFIAASYATQSVPDLLGSDLPLPMGQLFLDTLGKRGMLAIWSFIIVVQYVTGAAQGVDASRVVFAFARDNALPGSRWWKQINRYTQTPAALSSLAGAAVIGLYTSYATPILLRITSGRDKLVPGPFSLGRWYTPIGIVAVAWVSFIDVLLIFPSGSAPTADAMNYSVVIIMSVFIFAAGSWIVSARKWFTGPISNLTPTPSREESPRKE